MREVILHIGMHKTGTSSIQKSIQGLSENGIRVASFDEVNHSIPMYTMFSSERYDYHYWNNRGYSKLEIEQKKEEYFEILQKDLAKSNFGSLLISGEDLSVLSVSDQENLCSYFHEKDISVKVIYVVREPLSWAASGNQERAKHGGKRIQKLSPMYKNRVQGFLNKCGIANISIYKYETFLEKGLIKSFSEIIGIELEENSISNESISHEALALLYQFNNIGIPTQGTPQRFHARTLLCNAMFDFFSVQKNYSKLDLKDYDIIGENINEDLLWLKEHFGINYAQINYMPRSASIKVTVDPDTLSLFFVNFFCEYDEYLSLQENFTAVYVRILSFLENDKRFKLLLNENKLFEAKAAIQSAIECGDIRHSTYHKASKVSLLLKDHATAVSFAIQALEAMDNDKQSTKHHKTHLRNLLQLVSKLYDV